METASARTYIQWCRPFLYMCMFVWQSSLYIRVSQVLIPCASSLSAHGEAMDAGQAAIQARAEIVRKPFEYLGFAEWIAWGWHHKTRVMILLGDNVHGGSAQLQFRERDRDR